jgi:fumarylacetoacetase
MDSGASGFGIENLPYGVARMPDGVVTCVSALGEDVLDLAALAHSGAFRLPGPAGLPVAPEVFEQPTLNRFLSCGRPAWKGVRRRLADLITDEDPRLAAALVPRDEVELRLPVAVADFVDFYSSLHHATNMGRLFRPGTDPLPPTWRRQPLGYHGRAGSIAVSGAGVVRPHGQAGPDGGLRPTAGLDFEAEVGFVIGTGSRLGHPVPAAEFRQHVAGLLLVNDWSARDVQAFESQPLGPFLGKSFATSVSPWLVTLDALEPYRVDPPRQNPVPAPYLAPGHCSAYDLHLEVALQTSAMRASGAAPLTIARTRFADLYWTIPQLLAHATVNGAPLRTGDLFASGTVSGPVAGTEGSLMELAWNGARPLCLPDGSTRTYLEDGDTVILRGWAAGDGRPRLSLGEVRGTVLPARRLEV